MFFGSIFETLKWKTQAFYLKTLSSLLFCNPVTCYHHPSTTSSSTFPKNLFMKVESLNASTLYSSEPVRWQLIMSALMILQLKTPLQFQLAEAKVTAVLNSNCKEVLWDEGFRMVKKKIFQHMNVFMNKLRLEEKISPKSFYELPFRMV